MVSCLTLRLDFIGEENLIERLTCEWADSQLTIIHYFPPIKICNSPQCPLVSPIPSQFWGLLCGDDHAYWEPHCPGRSRDVRILFAAHEPLQSNPTPTTTRFSIRPAPVDLVAWPNQKASCFHIGKLSRVTRPVTYHRGLDFGSVSSLSTLQAITTTDSARE